MWLIASASLFLSRVALPGPRADGGDDDERPESVTGVAVTLSLCDDGEAQSEGDDDVAARDDFRCCCDSVCLASCSFAEVDLTALVDFVACICIPLPSALSSLLRLPNKLESMLTMVIC